jgi:dienelactone hydrolase
MSQEAVANFHNTIPDREWIAFCTQYSPIQSPLSYTLPVNIIGRKDELYWSIRSIKRKTAYGVSHESVQMVYAKRVDPAHCGHNVFLLAWPRSISERRKIMTRYFPIVLLIVALFLPAANFPTGTATERQAVSYRQGGEELNGYLAYDRSIQGPRPAVLVVHEWWGLNDYIRRRVNQLAGLGYIAFAADIYGNGFVTKDPQEAGKYAGKFRNNREFLRNRATAGLKVLLEQPQADRQRVAAIGYCFGGTTVLELARSGAPVLGVVSFHGGLDTPNPGEAEKIKGKILALHGADDPYVPPAQVAAFQAEMRKAKVDWQMVLYGGAVHSFTNPDSGSDPSKGMAYNEKADLRSWEQMKIFFAELFRPVPATPATAAASNRHESINLRAVAVSESQIALTWTIPNGVVKYRIYRGGSLLTTTGRISEYDAGLKANTRYCYRVSALDGQGGEFSESDEVCATTLMTEAAE